MSGRSPGCTLSQSGAGDVASDTRAISICLSYGTACLTGHGRAGVRGGAMPETRLWFESALLPDGWTAHVRCTIAHGRIARVERNVPAADADARHAIGVPGLVNVHSHALQRAM